MISVHDNEVISYEVNLREKILIIHTKKDITNQYYDLIFSDVLIHYFQDEINGSIILDVCEYSIDEFLSKYSELLEPKMFPIFQSTSFIDEEFKARLKNNSFFYYAITASYGFNGIVVSKKIQVVEI